MEIRIYQEKIEYQERGQTVVSSDGFGLLQEPNNPIFRLPLEEAVAKG